jgi:hypothetical protein
MDASTTTKTSRAEQCRKNAQAKSERKRRAAIAALAATEAALREKQRECDRLYGKLAAASPLTDSELRRALTEALERLKQAEEQHANR